MAYVAFLRAASRASENSTIAPEVTAAIISAAALVLVAVAGAALSRYFDRRQQIEQELRQRKAALYTKFLDYWFWAMRYRSKVSEKDRAKRDREYRSTVPQQLVVWGSEDFIKKLGKWLRGDEPEGTMMEFTGLLSTIRADLGYEDKHLDRRDLMHLFLEPNSVDRHLEERSSPEAQDDLPSSS